MNNEILIEIYKAQDLIIKINEIEGIIKILKITDILKENMLSRIQEIRDILKEAKIKNG